MPLVVKSAPALGQTNPESKPVSAVPPPKTTDSQSEHIVPEQVEIEDKDAKKHVTPNRRSDEAIESLQSLAGLLLTSNDAKRSLILRSRIMAADENSPVQELVGALVRRYGNQLTVRKLLDSQPESFVVDLFSRITWIGKNKAYRFVPPEGDPAEMREAVLCLTRLLLAHLAKGKAGVDSVAESSGLLQPVTAPKTYEPPVAQWESSVAEMEEPVQMQPSPPSAIIEAVAMSSSGEVLVTIGDEMLSLPSKAAKLMDAQWQGWSAIARDPDFDLSAAVALTPGLNQELVGVVVSLLQNGSRLRFVELGEGPSLREVALYLSSLPIESGTAASERLRAVFFDEQFANQETFLLGCLGALKEE